MGGKSTNIVLILVVSLLSLAVAVLSVFVFMGGNVVPKEKEKGYVAIPKDDEISKMPLFESKRLYNLKNDVNGNSKILQVNADLVYFKEVAGIKEPSAKITAYTSDLREVVSKYFQGTTIDQVNSATGREKIKKDLVKLLNDKLKSNEKSKNDIIYDIVFDEWVYQ